MIHNRINLLLESFSTLVQINNPEHESNIRRIFADQQQMIPEKQVIATKLLHYFDQVDTCLNLPQDRVTFFFKEPSTSTSLECRGSLFLAVCMEEPDLDQLIEKVKSFTTAERFEHIRVVMSRMLSQTPETLAYMSEHLTSESALFDEIFKSNDLSDQQKYDMFYIYYHYEALLAEFVALIQETSKSIAPLLDAFEEEVSTLVQTVETGLASKGIAYFSDAFNVDLGGESNFHIYPCITNSLTISFTNVLTSLDTFNIFFGIHILPFMQFAKDKGRSEKEMANFLKALADPSKLHILKLLKDDRLYASQLAEKLGISNATISHHMNALLQLEIIKFEKEQNRFYYSLEKKQLKSYIDCLSQQFDF